MKVSRSVGYALVAVAHVARNDKEGCVLSKDISKKYKIPVEYLLKIMQILTKVGIFCSKRGPKGGFRMGKPLKQISMLQVIEAIEGPTNFSVGLEDVKSNDQFILKAQKAFETSMQKGTKALSEIKVATLIS
jgi:Rrf2 family protein